MLADMFGRDIGGLIGQYAELSRDDRMRIFFEHFKGPISIAAPTFCGAITFTLERTKDGRIWWLVLGEFAGRISIDICTSEEAYDRAMRMRLLSGHYDPDSIGALVNSAWMAELEAIIAKLE